MSTKTSPKTIALFGGTAGVGLATLHQALEAGHTVNALARTPLKLAQLALHILTNFISSKATSETSLLLRACLRSTIESLISSSHPSGWLFNGKVSVSLQLVPARGPKIVLLSTTDISEKGRDIPLAIVSLYSLLSTPHIDKKNMEILIVNGEVKERNWILIRPSFLLNGASKGSQHVRVSTETPGAEKEAGSVAIGYTIRREDVPLWIVKECIDGDETKWLGKKVTLTY